MANRRISVLNSIENRSPKWIENVTVKRSSVYGENVFGKSVMQHHMTKEAFKAVINAMEYGHKIDRKVANQVASAMKDWALSKSATHFTHWFQPLTGATAEKHDAFFETIDTDIAIEKFSGGELVQQEPDASSFPNGGIRNTFEARGYTAWDPTSPAFIVGTTLCIPTIFVAYTGEALDNKTPLLRALHNIDEAATKVAKYFDKNVKKVTPTLGWEQEFFLIDSALAATRHDITLTGRTLLGHSPAKGQQLDDHYFGSIPLRVKAYLIELEEECIRLAIPVKTRHNEVAPNQFEIAPIFEETNLAVDHNSLLMDIMEKVASKHNFKVLFHEKPFANINGSGKHNNWSLATDTGVNLLAPGKTPKKNLEFLTFFINTIKAVHDHADILRAAIASAGNDHRLGANEAPPAIISVFIGEQLTKVLDELEKVTKGKLSPEEKTDLKLNIVGKIPDVLLDNTDRNRTSPFAFTGNKFEFRAVGSASNCAFPMTVLNTAVADQLVKFKQEVDALIKKKIKKDDAIFNVLRDYVKASKNIRFEGNGYTKDWEVEAEKRGLSNLRTTPQALEVLSRPKSVSFFSDNKVLSKSELLARHEVLLDDYILKIQIEGRVLGEMVATQIIPAAIQYQTVLLNNVSKMKEVFDDKKFKKIAKSQLDLIELISKYIDDAQKATEEMLEARKVANKLELVGMANAYCDTVKIKFEEIRYPCDKLERIVDNEMWPLMKYSELLFTK